MTILRFIPVACALALVAGAAVADDMKDPAMMSCKDFAAMDSDGMMKATMAMKEAATKDAMADSSKAMMADDEVMKMVMEACTGHDDMMAMDALHKSK